MKCSKQLGLGAVSVWLLCLAFAGCNSKVATKTNRPDVEPLVGDTSSRLPPEPGVEEVETELGPPRGYDLTGFDVDDDKRVSREEAGGQLLAVFDEIDANRDGFVDEFEFGAFLTYAQSNRPSTGAATSRDANEPAVIAMLERVGGAFQRAETGQGPGKIAIVTLVNTPATDKDLQELSGLTELFGLELAERSVHRRQPDPRGRFRQVSRPGACW